MNTRVSAMKTQEGTPLHSAAKNGLTGKVNRLIAKGIPVDVVDNLNRTPLYIAVSTQNLEMIDLLLSHGANPNASNSQRLYTCLHFAVAHQNHDMVLRLLKAGASLTIRHPQLDNTSYDSPLEYAMSSYDPSEVEFYLKYILEHQSEVDYNEIFNLNSPDLDPKIAKLGIQYLARMDDSINPHFFARALYRGNFYQDFYNKCVKELTEMKEHVIFRGLTIHELFARRGWVRVSLMKNQQLLDALESCDHETRYPIYRGMLEEHLFEAQSFRELYFDLLTTMEEEFEDCPALRDNMETILDYMSKDEIDELSTRYDQEEEKKQYPHLY